MSSQAEASAQAQTGGGGGKRKAPVKTDGPPKRQLTVRKHRLERGEEQYGLPFADTGKHKHIDFQSALDNAPEFGITVAAINVARSASKIHKSTRPPLILVSTHRRH